MVNDGGGGAAGVGQVPGPQHPVADLFEGVVHPLPVGAGVHLPAVVGAGSRERVEQGFEFGAEGAGEPKLSGPGPVTAGPELKVAPVGVQLIFGPGAVGVDGVDQPSATSLSSSGAASQHGR